VERRRLGDTDLDISRLGFGAWAIGGEGWAFGWGPQDDGESIATIRRAIDAGMNWVDTAAIYGFGRSETVVGRALAEIPAGQRPYVFSKCGLLPASDGVPVHSLAATSIRREVEESLRRLDVDAIDLYQIHWPALPPDIENAPDIVEGWCCLAELRRAGKVRHIGVCNFTRAQFTAIAKIAPVSSLQPPYSMIMRGVEREILPYCREHNVGVIVYSPMQSGLLTGAMTRERIAALPDSDWRKRNPQYQEPNLTANLKLVDTLRSVAERRRVSPGAVAVAWTLRHAAVTGAIVGARRPDQIAPLIPAAALELDSADLAAIEKVLPPSLGLFS
jgi:aryl-alcohol dehydrogenase-like predicted oxidoreductase